MPVVWQQPNESISRNLKPLGYNWFLAQESLWKLLSRVPLTSWVQLETHHEQYNSVGLDKIFPCNVTKCYGPHCICVLFCQSGGLSREKRSTRLHGSCWIAQLAAVRLMAACITHFRRDGSMSFLSNCVFDPTWLFTHFTTLWALCLLHHCGSAAFIQFLLLLNNPRCSTLRDSTMAPTKFMDLSVDIKTLIVQHVSLVLLVLLASPISLASRKYWFTESVMPWLQGCF